MNIGLVTLTPNINYGGTLQCFALYSYLKQQGHSVTLLNITPELKKTKKIIISLLENLPFIDIKNIKNIKLQKKFHSNWIESNIPDKSKELRTLEDINNIIEQYDFDAIIVGSDQVWRWEYINNPIYKAYFLNFKTKKKIKKISYAASFGKGEWENNNNILEISSFLADFNAISVREKSGIRICQKTFNLDMPIVHTLDPTLLINKSIYNKFIKKIDTPFVLSYILDQNDQLDDLIKEFKNIDIIDIYKNKKLLSINEWLSLFNNSKYIITDSFHGMVFSIIFNKNFTVIINEKRGADRFLSLLKELGLMDRIIYSTTISNKEKLIENIKKPIDYEVINNKLLELKVKSENFILSALNDE